MKTDSRHALPPMCGNCFHMGSRHATQLRLDGPCRVKSKYTGEFCECPGYRRYSARTDLTDGTDRHHMEREGSTEEEQGEHD